MTELAWEYWQDEGWFVGRLNAKPNVVTQGRTMAELEDNIRDAYELVCKYEEAESLGQSTTIPNRRTAVRLQDFLSELRGAGCYLKSRDSRHHIFVSTKNGKVIPVPHHPEIRETLAVAIRKQLGLLP